MLMLKTKYERGVESRNLAGVQLIDRNDELCILYEKSNLQEQTIKQGEIALRKKDDEERMLKLQLDELTRQIEAARKQLPQIPALAEKITSLQNELGMEKVCRVEDKFKEFTIYHIGKPREKSLLVSLERNIPR